MSKVIGTKYGIEITKPWNQKMYDWNELVGKLIKIDLYNKLEEFYKKGDRAGMNKIANSFGPSYGEGYDIDSVFDSVFEDIEQLQNYQINEELEWLVKDGLIKKPEFNFVGYDK
jgi:hypothetical protein